jgi:ClpP class serine protease
LIARTQKAVDLAYAQFVTGVVNGRGKGVTPEKVRTEWKAFVYGAAEALEIGMIDSIATLTETLTRVLSAGGAADQRAARALRATVDPTDPDACPTCHGDGRCPTCHGSGTISTPTDDTAQELARATAQDRQLDLTWQTAIDRELLTLKL